MHHNKSERSKLKRKMFCSMMRYNKKMGYGKGNGIKPKVTFGAFGKCKFAGYETTKKKKRPIKKDKSATEK